MRIYIVWFKINTFNCFLLGVGEFFFIHQSLDLHGGLDTLVRTSECTQFFFNWVPNFGQTMKIRKVFFSKLKFRVTAKLC